MEALRPQNGRSTSELDALKAVVHSCARQVCEEDIENAFPCARFARCESRASMFADSEGRNTAWSLLLLIAFAYTKLAQPPPNARRGIINGRIRMLVVFVCTANRLRSPTAEALFRDWRGVEVLSAGTDLEAPRPLTKDLVARADVIFAMEPHHRERIRKKFKHCPPDDRIITLHIPDEFERDQPELIALLKEKVTSRLEALQGK